LEQAKLLATPKEIKREFPQPYIRSEKGTQLPKEESPLPEQKPEETSSPVPVVVGCLSLPAIALYRLEGSAGSLISQSLVF